VLILVSPHCKTLSLPHNPQFKTALTSCATVRSKSNSSCSRSGYCSCRYCAYLPTRRPILVSTSHPSPLSWRLWRVAVTNWENVLLLPCWIGGKGRGGDAREGEGESEPSGCACVCACRRTPILASLIDPLFNPHSYCSTHPSILAPVVAFKRDRVAQHPRGGWDVCVGVGCRRRGAAAAAAVHGCGGGCCGVLLRVLLIALEQRLLLWQL